MGLEKFRDKKKDDNGYVNVDAVSNFVVGGKALHNFTIGPNHDLMRADWIVKHGRVFDPPDLPSDEEPYP